MVEVAMVYDLPNKLIMPALWNQDASCSMLGLGDILLPGLYLAFLNKFDKHVKTSSYLPCICSKRPTKNKSCYLNNHVLTPMCSMYT